MYYAKFNGNMIKDEDGFLVVFSCCDRDSMEDCLRAGETLEFIVI